MSPELAVQAAIGVIVSFFAWSLKRNLSNLDENIKGLVGKVDGLSAKDTVLEIQMAELKVRIMHVEMDVARLVRAMGQDS